MLSFLCLHLYCNQLRAIISLSNEGFLEIRNALMPSFSRLYTGTVLSEAMGKTLSGWGCTVCSLQWGDTWGLQSAAYSGKTLAGAQSAA
jgi:homoserine kinase